MYDIDIRSLSHSRRFAVSIVRVISFRIQMDDHTLFVLELNHKLKKIEFRINCIYSKFVKDLYNLDLIQKPNQNMLLYYYNMAAT